MNNIYDLIKRAEERGLLTQAGWKRNFLDCWISEYEWGRVFDKEELAALKSYKDDFASALYNIDIERKRRYDTGTATREDIVRLLDKNIYDNATQWGDDYIYTDWARKHKEKVLYAYDNGLEPVSVAKIDWHYDNGYDYEYYLYTDGSVKCSIYGAY